MKYIVVGQKRRSNKKKTWQSSLFKLLFIEPAHLAQSTGFEAVREAKALLRSTAAANALDDLAAIHKIHIV